MTHPWLDIPLEDYERHMSLPAIGQAQMLAERFESLIRRYQPASCALIGCAGGNGLDRILSLPVERIVAVDINPAYVQQTAARFASRFRQLDTLCADVQSASLSFGPVDLIYAGLVFEYVQPAAALAALRRNCRRGGILAAVLQLTSPAQPVVSPSPYRSLQSLAAVMRPVAPAELQRQATAAGFVSLETETIALPSGRQFLLQTFRC